MAEKLDSPLTREESKLFNHLFVTFKLEAERGGPYP